MYNTSLSNLPQIELDSPIQFNGCFIDSISTVFSGTMLNSQLILRFLDMEKRLLGRQKITLSEYDQDSEGKIKIREDFIFPIGTNHILAELTNYEWQINNDPTLCYKYF